MKNIYFLLLVGIVLLAACTAGPNTHENVNPPDGHTARFLIGIWHGIIAPFSFIISLFTHKISMYEIYNNGGWYDFGFVLGAGILFGGSVSAAKKRQK